MKKIALLLVTGAVLFSCNNDDDSKTTTEPDPVTVDFQFTQYWDGDRIANADYQTTTYLNANNTMLKLSKLVYLISDITFTAQDGTVYDAGDYSLIDARNGTNATFTPDIEIPEGDYEVSFTFGFDDEDNDKTGGYPDLNSSDGSWSVPMPLGGGYHYMRMEGTFLNEIAETKTFQYHTIRANKHTTLPPADGTLESTQDTSFVVNLGTVTVGNSTTVEVQMNAAEWFKNPNTWDLNINNSVMMPNFNLQIDMNENGSNGVFNLGTVSQ
ncbi:MbnP family protein [Rasiella sp. SM2506]|uniref:MbnP family protein n=1 Tax=Rasiella sp. SM2506 TaxID=3423914 RepID=UPI003D798A91